MALNFKPLWSLKPPLLKNLKLIVVALSILLVLGIIILKVDRVALFSNIDIKLKRFNNQLNSYIDRGDPEYEIKDQPLEINNLYKRPGLTYIYMSIKTYLLYLRAAIIKLILTIFKKIFLKLFVIFLGTVVTFLVVLLGDPALKNDPMVVSTLYFIFIYITVKLCFTFGPRIQAYIEKKYGHTTWYYLIFELE